MFAHVCMIYIAEVLIIYILQLPSSKVFITIWVPKWDWFVWGVNSRCGSGSRSIFGLYSGSGSGLISVSPEAHWEVGVHSSSSSSPISVSSELIVGVYSGSGSRSIFWLYSGFSSGPISVSPELIGGPLWDQLQSHSVSPELIVGGLLQKSL